MRPRRPILPIAATAVMLAVVTLGLVPQAQTRFMPVSEIRPGMVATGRTVFAGTALEEFRAEILGVLRNVLAPGRDLILARLEGGPLARTGVIAGMSGSPLTIDGRLIGAVSYSLGQFATEPIAGITPIAEMTDATQTGAVAPRLAPVALAWPHQQEALAAAWSQALMAGRPRAVQATVPSVGTALLRPVALPLSAAGFDASVLSSLSSVFDAAGLLPLAAQPASASAEAPSQLEAGGAIGVSLMSGDFEMGATGTVTHIDGPRVYAFGHPMYNLGPTRFPMTTAYVHVVLPSLMQSSKLASFGKVVGTLVQDRSTAVAGEIGAAPSLIPMTVQLKSGRLGDRTFSFQLVRDTTFTPLLAYLAVANVLTSYERANGPASFRVTGTADVVGAGTLAFDDTFVGDQAIGPAALYVAGPLTQLTRNASAPVDLSAIRLTVTAAEQTRHARIERIWLDTPRPRAGQRTTLLVALKTPTGEERLERIPLTLPAEVTGPVTLLVADAARAAADDRRTRPSADWQPAAELVRQFNRLPAGHRLYVRLQQTRPGAVVSGELMPALPPSVSSVLNAGDDEGRITPLPFAIRATWEHSVGLAVSGARQLSLTVEHP
jgi:hypothetical protein